MKMAIYLTDKRGTLVGPYLIRHIVTNCAKTDSRQFPYWYTVHVGEATKSSINRPGALRTALEDVKVVRYVTTSSKRDVSESARSTDPAYRGPSAADG